tara:strand:+ start:11797 stop:12171 length:375 start_codon:yes stop_codon:yes gene_type:complete
MTKNNLYYSLKERNVIKNSNSDPDLSWMKELQYDPLSNKDEILSKELLLELEFTECNLKELIKFCDYYKISRKKLKKQDIIRELILFEINEDNIEIVETRRTLWEYFLTLKEDSFFKKFIICDI